MEFFKDPYHLALVATALISGTMLLASMFKRREGDISPTEATLLINREDALVIDVREPPEFIGGHIAGARNIPLARLAERLSELEQFKTRTIIVTCAAGSRSATAYKTLVDAGFSTVKNLAGGVGAWQQANLPLVKKGKK